MRYWTLAEIRTKIEKDLAIEDEIFVESDELTGYINDAIDDAEGEIHSAHQDYFRAKAPLTLVNTEEEIDLPDNIYAFKIRSIWYRNGSTVYQVKELPMEKKAARYELEKAGESSGPSEYVYDIDNTTPGAPKLIIIPAAQESGQYLTMYYLRNANRLEEDADVCDIPEFVSFIFAFVRECVYRKEGHPGHALALAMLNGSEPMGIVGERQKMQAVLAKRTAEPTNEIEADFSFYREHL